MNGGKLFWAHAYGALTCSSSSRSSKRRFSGIILRAIALSVAPTPRRASSLCRATASSLRRCTFFFCANFAPSRAQRCADAFF